MTVPGNATRISGIDEKSKNLRGGLYRFAKAVVGQFVTRRRQTKDETEPTEAYQKPQVASLAPGSDDGMDSGCDGRVDAPTPTTTPESNCIHA